MTQAHATTPSDSAPASDRTPNANLVPRGDIVYLDAAILPAGPIGFIFLDVAESLNEIEFIWVEHDIDWDEWDMSKCSCKPSEEMVPTFMGPMPVETIRDSECPLHGDTAPVKPPQEIADKQALLAQKYAGYMVGHPYSSTQYGKGDRHSEVDIRKKWKEPNVVPDDCVFCVRMTDEDVDRRIRGFQSMIDKEVIRRKSAHYGTWLTMHPDEVPNPDGGNSSVKNRRRFCELNEDRPTEKRPTGWEEKPFPLVDLPMRLKRKLCVEWNHTYLPWMEENGLEYDPSDREFRGTAPPKATPTSDSQPEPSESS